jgi:hypothetical protein
VPNSFLNPRRIGGQSLKALGTGTAKPPKKSGLEQEAQMQFTRMSGITPRITRAFQQKPARFVPRLKAAKGIK